MSQSPLEDEVGADSIYINSFLELAQRIRAGASFSGRERNCAFLNISGESFADGSAALGLDLKQDSRGLAICDWDHDGDLDLWLTNRTAPRLQLIQNQGEGKSLQIQLIGDPALGTPRDAAGARVQGAHGDGIQSRTVYLGNGFVSQSSKWLHFGLGDTQPGELTVFWPGGGEEKFAGFESGGRYTLRQGSGKAENVSKEVGKLKAAKLDLPRSSDEMRIWLSKPKIIANVDLPEGPSFLHLWASWCPACNDELSEFSTVTDLPIRYLNVEKADGMTQEGMSEFLKSNGVSVPGEFAGEKLLESLDGAVKDVIYRHRNLPVPATFLLDSDQKLRAIYKGRVEVGTLRADLKLLSQGSNENRDESVPFPGRWSSGLFETNPIAVAMAYEEGGYIDDARSYLMKFLGKLDLNSEGGMQRQAEIYFHLGRLSRSRLQHEEAVENFKITRTSLPDHRAATILQALSLAELGRAKEALDIVQSLQNRNPRDPNFLNLEAEVYELLGDDEKAAVLYQQVLKSAPRYVPAINSLASLLATSSDENVRDGQAALRLAKFLSSAPGARNQLDFVRTLAEAYAGSGEFKKALGEIARAKKLIEKYPVPRQLEELETRRKFFEVGEPFHRPTKR